MTLMTYHTFSYWRHAPAMSCPLIINRDEPSEARLVARGDYVFIYRYTKPFRPKPANRRRTDSGNPQRKQTMKKAAAPMKATAKKGAMKPAPAKAGMMPMKKGYK